MDERTLHHVHESPLSMTAVLVLLATGSALGGFVAIPQFLQPQLPWPSLNAAMAAMHSPVIYLSATLGFVGLAGAAWLFGGDAQRAETLRRRFAGVHRLLSGKYFVDEAYDTLIGRPLQWVSERVFLAFGDRLLLDGSLHGLAALARRTADALARVQTGNLQLYLVLALLGLLGALAWSALRG